MSCGWLSSLHHGGSPFSFIISRDTCKICSSCFKNLFAKSCNFFSFLRCGHCQRLEPEWKKAASELKGKVNLGALDATVHQGMAQRYGVQGFPTIKYFAPGSEPVDYQGGRSASDIVQFGLSKMAENVPAPDVVQLTETKILSDNCNEKPLCVVSVLPDILDTGASGRNAYLDILKEVGDKYKSKLWGWVWSEAGKQSKLEEALGMGGFGYPTLAVVNVRKMKYSILKGSFDKTGIDEFLRRLAVGRGSTEPIRGAALPELDNVEAWDGKDGQLPEEEDIDLSDFDMDDDSGKDEL